MAQTATTRTPRRELTARKAYFKETDSVLGLFNQTREQAEAAMASSVLVERSRPEETKKEPTKKAVKLYDAEPGMLIPVTSKATEKKKKFRDKYPCLRSMALGFLIAAVMFAVAVYIAGIA